MNPHVFKIIHVLSVLLLFYAFGALSSLSAEAREGTTNNRTADNANAYAKRIYKALHGLALLLILLTGLAQMHLLKTGFPVWIQVKMGVWLLIGGSLSLVVRRPHWRSWTWALLLAIAAVAVTAAIIH